MRSAEVGGVGPAQVHDRLAACPVFRPRQDIWPGRTTLQIPRAPIPVGCVGGGGNTSAQ